MAFSVTGELDPQENSVRAKSVRSTWPTYPYDRFKSRFYPPLLTGSWGEYLRVVGILVIVE